VFLIRFLVLYISNVRRRPLIRDSFVIVLYAFVQVNNFYTLFLIIFNYFDWFLHILAVVEILPSKKYNAHAIEITFLLFYNQFLQKKVIQLNLNLHDFSFTNFIIPRLLRGPHIPLTYFEEAAYLLISIYIPTPS